MVMTRPSCHSEECSDEESLRLSALRQLGAEILRCAQDDKTTSHIST